MKKSLLVLIITLISTISFSQTDDCYSRLQKAFNVRGANPVSNDMHRNVIISYFQTDGSAYCISGKVRVENGKIVSIFIQYDDNTYELMEKDFYNDKNKNR